MLFSSYRFSFLLVEIKTEPKQRPYAYGYFCDHFSDRVCALASIDFLANALPKRDIAFFKVRTPSAVGAHCWTKNVLRRGQTINIYSLAGEFHGLNRERSRSLTRTLRLSSHFSCRNADLETPS